MAKKNGLTVKQERFVEAMADPTTETMSDAARKAGYAESNAAKMGHVLAKKHPETQQLIARKKKQKVDRSMSAAAKALHHVEKLQKKLDGAIDDAEGSVEIAGLLNIAVQSVDKLSQLQEKAPSLFPKADRSHLFRTLLWFRRAQLAAIDCALDSPEHALRIKARIEGELPDFEEWAFQEAAGDPLNKPGQAVSPRPKAARSARTMDSRKARLVNRGL